MQVFEVEDHVMVKPKGKMLKVQKTATALVNENNEIY